MARKSPDQMQMSFGAMASPEDAAQTPDEPTAPANGTAGPPNHANTGAAKTPQPAQPASETPQPEEPPTQVPVPPAPVSDKKADTPVPPPTANPPQPATDEPAAVEEDRPGRPGRPDSGGHAPSRPETVDTAEPALTKPSRTGPKAGLAQNRPQGDAPPSANRTSTRSDGARTALRLGAETTERPIILDLSETTSPGGWVSQSYAEGLATTLKENGAADAVTIRAHTAQANTVLKYMHTLLGVKLNIAPPAHLHAEETAPPEKQEETQAPVHAQAA